MASRQSDKVRSFSQFDGGAGTAAAKRGKKTKTTKPAARSAAPKPSSGPRPKTESDVRRDMREHRRSVLQGGKGRRQNQGAPGAGEGKFG